MVEPSERLVSTLLREAGPDVSSASARSALSRCLALYDACGFGDLLDRDYVAVDLSLSLLWDGEAGLLRALDGWFDNAAHWAGNGP